MESTLTNARAREAEPTCTPHFFQRAVREAATICPAPCNLTFDLLTLKVVSESRATRSTSVPILVFLGLSVLELGPMATHLVFLGLSVLDVGPM